MQHQQAAMADSFHCTVNTQLHSTVLPCLTTATHSWHQGHALPVWDTGAAMGTR
jgi:hypothetical protein